MWRHPDRTAQGDPETVVVLGSGEALIGMQIRGLPKIMVLGVREDKEGWPLGCAIVDAVSLDITPLHSNPRRKRLRE